MPVFEYGSDGVGTGAGSAGGGILLEPIALRIWKKKYSNLHRWETLDKTDKPCFYVGKRGQLKGNYRVSNLMRVNQT